MTSAATEVTVPDIGDFSDVPIIEVHVAVGDVVHEEDPLLTLESDKATMDVPSSSAGTVTEVLVSVGDQVSQGSPVVLLDPGSDGSGAGSGNGSGDGTPPGSTAGGAGAAAPAGGRKQGVDDVPPDVAEEIDHEVAAQEPTPDAGPAKAPTPPARGSDGNGTTPVTASAAGSPGSTHAGPSVRKMAREFGIDLSTVPASGPKGRITKEDLLAHLRGPEKAAPAAPAPAATSGGSGIPEIPAQDFSVFGPVETQPLSRITKLSGPALHRSWLNIPHVTHDDDADITDIDRYRKELDTAAKAEGYRVTLLSFLIKAAVSGLKAFPAFNSSLSPEKDSLILKRYYNIGVAVDTPGGLVVPVVRDADRKGIVAISKELGEVSARARDGKLTADDMRGATFTISSLGGIGGTAFTPIINAPEVAILGVVRSKVSPVWDGEAFVPRTLLPLSLSYDHRVIDGAQAARFTRHLCHLLEDERRLLL
jgi:pyruvate dehydrogenase E2 component (dihydrolipoamide acetyltransferase)